MNLQNLFLLLLFTPIFSFSQNQSSFEDGTLQGWTNKDGATTLLTVEENYPKFYLQKDCDGSNSPVGEMTIVNADQWAGNYFYEGEGGSVQFLGYTGIYMKNENDFDLHLRYGFIGANDYMVVTTDPIFIPAFSDWSEYIQSIGVSFSNIFNLTIINDTTGLPDEEIFENVHELFEDVVEFRIFHNEDISFDGQNVTGTLQIEFINTFMLSNEDHDLAKVTLYPNPVNSIINLETPSVNSGSINLYNVLGEKVLSKEFSSTTTHIDVSELKSGIYLAKIQTENQSIVKKIVKL